MWIVIGFENRKFITIHKIGEIEGSNTLFGKLVHTETINSYFNTTKNPDIQKPIVSKQHNHTTDDQVT